MSVAANLELWGVGAGLADDEFISLKTVQNRLGHANASIALNWYAHALPENDRKAADLFGNILANRPLSVIDDGKVRKAV